jgi:RNA-binding protein YlmH
MLNEERLKRIKELESRSFERGIFTFSDFMSPTSLYEATSILKVGKYTVFGGEEFAERKMFRFGDMNDFGYEEPFPITVLKISLQGGKFASPISHRDVLGAVLNLGIERQKLGDIFVNGNFSYIIADKLVAELIKEELKTVGRNKVEVSEVERVPSEFAPSKKQMQFSVASNRVDAVLCKAYSLSREDGANLFNKGFVAINGKPCESPSKPLKEGDVVTARGYGKLIFEGEGGLSKKGKLYVTISRFI